jgi:hypothetical protein
MDLNRAIRRSWLAWVTSHGIMSRARFKRGRFAGPGLEPLELHGRHLGLEQRRRVLFLQAEVHRVGPGPGRQGGEEQLINGYHRGMPPA